MDYASLSQVLKDTLSLSHEPIAVAKATSQQQDIGLRNKSATTTCRLWKEAETQRFVATPQEHAGCSVGCHVMGLPMSPDVADNLGSTIGVMADTQYLNMDEVPNIPTLGDSEHGISYGPLASHSGPLDAAVVWVTPAQAMLLNEAIGGAQWDSGEQRQLEVTGRPACAAIANTQNKGCASMSLGCSGMRLFTEIDPSLSLFVIPPAATATLATKLREVASSNASMLVEYRKKQQELSAA